MQAADNAAVMNRLWTRERYALMEYVADANPWTGSAEQKQTLDQLQRIIAEERQASRRVADYLRSRKIAPAFGHFPASFEGLGFVGLDYLLPRLATSQQWAIQELEKDLSSLTDPEARDIAQSLLALKRRHLNELQNASAHLEVQSTKV